MSDHQHDPRELEGEEAPVRNPFDLDADHNAIADGSGFASEFAAESTVETPLAPESTGGAGEPLPDATMAESLFKEPSIEEDGTEVAPSASTPDDEASARLSIDELGDAFPREASKITPASSLAVDVDALGDAFPEESQQLGYAGTLRLGSPIPPSQAGSADVVAAPQDVDMVADAIANSLEASALAGNEEVRQPTAAVVLSSAIDDAWAEMDADERSWDSLAGDRGANHGDQDNTDVKKSPEPASIASEKPRLVCVNGDRAGEEYVLGGEVTVGRATQSAIVLTDVSVSRQHATIYREGNYFYVLDKNTVNGTFVNGKRVRRQRLASRDEVSFGKVRFVFCLAGDAEQVRDEQIAAVRPSSIEPEPEDVEAPASSSVLTYVLASVGILLLATVIGLGAVYFRRQGQSTSRPNSAQYFAAGVTALQARQWTAAQAQFNLFLALEPTSDAGRSYLERIEREKAFEKQLEAARVAFSRGELLPAYTQATAITDSVYSEDARALARAIDAELEKRINWARLALGAGQPQQALDMLVVVNSIRPNRSDVAALIEQARKAVGGQRVRVVKPDVDSERRHVVVESDPTVKEAVELFAAGRVDDAITKVAASANSRDAAPTLANMKKFKALYDEAMVSFQAKRAEDAIRGLNQCKNLEAKISGVASSALREDLRRKLADMYFVRGSDYWVLDRYAEALASFRDALAHDRNHDATRRRLAMMTSQSSALLAEAERMQTSEPEKAKSRYKLLLQLLPSSDERYRKAKQRLDAMP